MYISFIRDMVSLMQNLTIRLSLTNQTYNIHIIKYAAGIDLEFPCF